MSLEDANTAAKTDVTTVGGAKYVRQAAALVSAPVTGSSVANHASSTYAGDESKQHNYFWS